MSTALLILLSLSLRVTVALTACFTESPFASTCEPTSKVTSSVGIGGCFRPDLQPSDDSGAGVSVVWDSSTGSCERRPTSCGSFATCSGRCLVSCDVATRGFLVLSLRAASGVKMFDLIDTPSSSNGSVIVVSTDVAQLPSVFRANVLDQLSSVVSRLSFKEMVVTLFVGSSVAVNVTFDVSHSPGDLNRTNWFSQSRLKACWPVTYLSNQTFNYFSISGDFAGVTKRRVFINYNYGGCENDAGLMVALDEADGCSWGGNFTAAPKLLYSIQPTVPYVTSIQVADKLVVTLR